MARRPRSSEASPATTERPAAKAKTTSSPLWNGAEINWGKKVWPVSRCRLDVESVDSALLAARGAESG